MTKRIRWGIIGCGDVTEVKSGPGFRKAGDSELVAVMRRDAALAADYSKRHGVPRWYDDADAILRDPDIDAVYVATPPSSHREHVLRCAAAGKPVLVEKPMALDRDECDAMLAACRAAGVPLWVAYYRRALPRFLAVRDLVASGTIGRVRMVITRQFQRLPEKLTPSQAWRLETETSGGGIFVDVASHTLDVLDFLFGPIEAVRAFAANQAHAYRPEDVVTASYRFASGVHGSGAWCFAAGFDEEYNEIVGERGRIRFSTTRAVPIQVLRGDACEEIAAADPPHVHQPLIQTIVDELNGNGRCPSTGETAARTTAVIDQVLHDYRDASRRAAADATQ